jgi:hypothetical protein
LDGVLGELHRSGHRLPVTSHQVPAGGTRANAGQNSFSAWVSMSPPRRIPWVQSNLAKATYTRSNPHVPLLAVGRMRAMLLDFAPVLRSSRPDFYSIDTTALATALHNDSFARNRVTRTGVRRGRGIQAAGGH